jgi:cell division protein FtsN
MYRWKALSGALLCLSASNLIAQTPARATDPVFVRAQTLVSDGNGVAGRALIDSMIAATPPMAPLYPQALFWRATLAANAADAESDYKHIVVDYPLAPQAADALLRLAQLELARGDRDAALAHLKRIPRDYPRSKLLARSSYWTARVLFEKNDVPNACAANADALAQADTTEIELRNQIQYQAQRCPSNAVVTASSPAASSANGANGVIVPSSPTPPQSPSIEASTTTTAQASQAQATTPRPKPPEKAADANPSIVDPAKAPKAATEKPPAIETPASTANAPAGVEKNSTKPRPLPAIVSYSVQVAAYTHRAEAESLVSTLKKRGYEARVDGTVAPFRVRIGRYATEADAEDALKKIKAKHMDGFVARVAER